eukprot:NODE_521_length_7287_cov_0.275042.p1 type:complete len:407 gc:universal NODE_521_length_7287_cov_0.275042:4031-5251(+)
MFFCLSATVSAIAKLSSHSSDGTLLPYISESHGVPLRRINFDEYNRALSNFKGDCPNLLESEMDKKNNKICVKVIAEAFSPYDEEKDKPSDFNNFFSKFMESTKLRSLPTFMKLNENFAATLVYVNGIDINSIWMGPNGYYKQADFQKSSDTRDIGSDFSNAIDSSIKSLMTLCYLVEPNPSRFEEIHSFPSDFIDIIMEYGRELFFIDEMLRSDSAESQNCAEMGRIIFKGLDRNRFELTYQKAFWLKFLSNHRLEPGTPTDIALVKKFTQVFKDGNDMAKWLDQEYDDTLEKAYLARKQESEINEVEKQWLNNLPKTSRLKQLNMNILKIFMPVWDQTLPCNEIGDKIGALGPKDIRCGIPRVHIPNNRARRLQRSLSQSGLTDPRTRLLQAANHASAPNLGTS